MNLLNVWEKKAGSTPLRATQGSVLPSPRHLSHSRDVCPAQMPGTPEAYILKQVAGGLVHEHRGSAVSRGHSSDTLQAVWEAAWLWDQFSCEAMKPL